MVEKKQTQKEKSLKEHAVSETTKLLTASLAFVAALAWNQLIQELINNYVKPLFGNQTGLISLLIYAIVVSIIAVTATYLLSKFTKNQ
jgi:uncharacterized membrane protein (DUF106 family)